MGEQAWDIEVGNDHLLGVRVQRSVLEEDGLVGGPACHRFPHASGQGGKDPRRDEGED